MNEWMNECMNEWMNEWEYKLLRKHERISLLDNNKCV